MELIKVIIQIIYFLLGIIEKIISIKNNKIKKSNNENQ